MLKIWGIGKELLPLHYKRKEIEYGEKNEEQGGNTYICGRAWSALVYPLALP